MTTKTLYIATCPALPGMAKIGFTKAENSVEDRFLPHNRAFPPEVRVDPYLEIVLPVDAVSAIERQVKRLTKPGDGEWVRVTADMLVKIVAGIIELDHPEHRDAFRSALNEVTSPDKSEDETIAHAQSHSQPFAKSRYHRLREEGLCVVCQKPAKEIPGGEGERFAMCGDCKDKYAKKDKERNAAKRAAELSQ